MSELKEKYIQFCCDFYNEYAPEDKLWFGRMYDECLQEHNKRNSTMYRWQFPLMILKDRQAEIDQLNSVLDERTKEWLQAIECGTYFENVAKPLKTEIDQLKAELALCREENKGLVESLNGEKALTTEALSQMRQKALILSEDCDGYKDPVQICQSEGVGWCVRFLETALQGGDQNTKNKAQSIENTGHEGGDQKALRGEHG